jgi:hypothetical protein
MMMDRAALTAGYLDAVARQGVGASELNGVIPRTGILGERSDYLSRPLFLGHAESTQLNADLQHLRTALVSLPARMYGGDLAAFGQAMGLTDDQVSTVRRGQSGSTTQLARADMYPTAAGLRLMEFNMGSGVSGAENSEFCRAMLRHPVLREFARQHRLHYVDTTVEEIGLIFDETGFKRGSYPMVAVVDWPGHYVKVDTFLHRITQRWRSLGLDAHACHLGQLKVSNGRVRLRGRPVDIIFRIFLAEHLLTPEGHALMDPVLDAVARDEVILFTPLDSEMFGSKAPLAMLSDQANRHLFSPAELAAIDRVLPWTRMVRPGPVTLEDGHTVDLYDYAVGHADDLVLKPTLLHAGKGVVPGWPTETTEVIWRDQLTKAMGGPYVLQRRIRPEPELCPGDDGEAVPWVVTWGVFTFPAGYGGVYARAFPVDSPHEITTAGRHLTFGCALTGGPDAAGAVPGQP